MLVLASAPYTSLSAHSSVVAELSHQFPLEARPDFLGTLDETGAEG